MAAYHDGPGQAPMAFYPTQQQQQQTMADPHHARHHHQQLAASQVGAPMWMADGPAATMRQDGYGQPALASAAAPAPPSGGGGYWPMPQAPRLTAAAPRISANAAMYYDPQLHMQHHHHGHAGYYSAHHAPTPTHWSYGCQPQPGQFQPSSHLGGAGAAPGAHPQVQHHAQLEHQILLHHQLSKLQQDNRRSHGQAPYHQPPHHLHGAQAAAGAGGRSAPHHASQRHHAEADRWSHRGSRGSISSRPQSYAPSARTSPGFSRESSVGAYVQDPWGQHQQQQQQQPPVPHHHHHQHHMSFDASAAAAAAAAAGAWQAGANGGGPWQEPAPLLEQPAHPPTWTAAHQQAYAPRFGADANARRQQDEASQQAAAYNLAPVAPQARAGIDANWAEVRASIGAVGTSGAWDDARYRAGSGAAQAVQPTIAIPDEAAALQTQQPAQKTQAKADAADKGGGAAPASPETLDKSSTPLSSYGAEVIWSACAALLDPTILLEFVGNEPLTSDASSSVSTPATSPHQRGALANADDHAKSTAGAEAAGNLLRLAVDGALAESSSALQGAAGSEATSIAARTFSPSEMGISSPGSSISSSEPGTPPSLVNSAVLPAPTESRMPSMKGLGLDSVTMGRMGSSNGSPMDTAASSPRSAASRSRRASVQQQGRPSYSGSSPRPERCTAQVRGVLRLISPDWRWSLNDDTLPSLESSLRPEAISAKEKAAPTSTSMRRRTSGSSMRESGGNSFLSTEINPAFRRFAHQVLAQTLLSPTAFLLALLYAARVPFLASNRGEMEAEAKEIFVQPPSVAPFKLFALGAIMANKHLDDNTYLNKTWHEVTGIPLVEINRMERWYLEKCGYETTVPENVWVAFLKRVRAREEHKLAMAAAARRARIVTHMRAAAAASGRPTAEFMPRRISDAQLASPATEEVSKRLLMSVDEALAALGHIAPLELAEPSLPTITPARNSPEPGEVAAASTVPPSSQDAGAAAAAAAAAPAKQSPERGRMRRPTASLQHAHHHCHSAPAQPATLGEVHPSASDEDLFQEEDGPYRPHAARSSVELSLGAARRSNSDWAAVAASRATHALPARPTSTVTASAAAAAAAAVRPVVGPSTLFMDHILGRERQHGLAHAH